MKSLQARRSANSILPFYRNPLCGNPRAKQTSGVKNRFSWGFSEAPCRHAHVCPSPSLQREDGAAVDSRRRLQDLLLRDEPKPHPVLGLWLDADPDRRDHPAAGPLLQPGHQAQTGLIVDPLVKEHYETIGILTGVTVIGKKKQAVSSLFSSVERRTKGTHQEPVTQTLELTICTKSDVPLGS